MKTCQGVRYVLRRLYSIGENGQGRCSSVGAQMSYVMTAEPGSRSK